MNNTDYYNYIINKKATSLMEIMLAVVVLAFTFMPIIATIGTSTKDTDVANSYVFAQTTARNILDTLLDDVPFNSINGPSGGDVGTLSDYTANGKTYSIASFKEMIGTKNDKCEGVLTDERGVNYNITIYVEPIYDSNFYFTYLPKPKFEVASNSDTGESNWYNIPRNDSEKKSKAFLNPNFNYDPYELKTKIYTVATESKKLSELWQVKNDNLSVMKKILLKIEWTGRDHKNRSLEIYTMKANLDTLG